MAAHILMTSNALPPAEHAQRIANESHADHLAQEEVSTNCQGMIVEPLICKEAGVLTSRLHHHT